MHEFTDEALAAHDAEVSEKARRNALEDAVTVLYQWRGSHLDTIAAAIRALSVTPKENPDVGDL